MQGRPAKQHRAVGHSNEHALSDGQAIAYLHWCSTFVGSWSCQTPACQHIVSLLKQRSDNTSDAAAGFKIASAVTLSHARLFRLAVLHGVASGEAPARQDIVCLLQQGFHSAGHCASRCTCLGPALTRCMLANAVCKQPGVCDWVLPLVATQAICLLHSGRW